MLIVWDQNFHLDSPCNLDTSKFCSKLQAHDLRQWVKGPTHKRGHTLDIGNTRDSSSLLSDISLTDPALYNKINCLAGDHLDFNSLCQTKTSETECLFANGKRLMLTTSNRIFQLLFRKLPLLNMLSPLSLL